jgi:ERCC4-type nuclease
MESVTIYTDVRETEKIKNILKKKCELKEKQLHIGDYLLSDRMAVERKTVTDLVNSIMDGRLFRQLYELRQEFEFPILIIEGKDLFTDTKIHPSAIRGAIASIVSAGTQMIWTKNEAETSEMLYFLAKREQIKEKKSISLRGKKKFLSENEMQEFLVSGIPKISTQKARSLLKHFGSPSAIFTAKEDELCEVNGIGKGLAKNIRSLLETEYKASIR